jgi:predicted transposase/invertase (TIGR01784 family)
LEGFLSELLFTDIKILEVLESETNKETADDKLTRVDIKVKDSDNKIYLIEVQYSRELDYIQRILFGASKTITEHLEKGLPFSNVVKIFSVNILYFDFGKGDDYIYHGTTVFKGIHSNTELKLNEAQEEFYKTKKIADIYPEFYLIDVKNFDDIAEDSLAEWVYFLKNGDIKDEFKAKGLEEAKEKLDVLKMGDAERADYERFEYNLHYQASMYQSTYISGQIEGKKEGMEEGIKEGMGKGIKKGKKEGVKEGMEKGKQEGVKEGTLAMAKALKEKGVDLDIIVDSSGLSKEQIAKL